MPIQRKSHIKINGVWLWPCGCCKKNLPRSAYYGKATIPIGTCKACVGRQSSMRNKMGERTQEEYIEVLTRFQEWCRQREDAFVVGAARAFRREMGEIVTVDEK